MNLVESIRKDLNKLNEAPYELDDSNTYFTELSDSPVLEPGNTEIWYLNSGNSRDYSMGWDWMQKHLKSEPQTKTLDGEEFKSPQLPDANNLSATHTLLGTISETDLNEIYSLMQGENWSPNSEANQMIRSKGLGHTSMSMGDIIVVNGNAYMVDDYGFVNITTCEKAD